jgi:hypothetical protein
MIEQAGSLLLAGRGRAIMGLVADVTTEEKHKDETQITNHPVDQGSPISDHAYNEPPELTVKVGWSGSQIELSTIYQGLLLIKEQFVRLVVMTGKRLYSDMLIKSISMTTDITTENSLFLEINFKKVFVVKTSETIVTIDNQAAPEATAGVQNGGTVQKAEVSESILSQITGMGEIGGAYEVGF